MYQVHILSAEWQFAAPRRDHLRVAKEIQMELELIVAGLGAGIFVGGIIVIFAFLLTGGGGDDDIMNGGM